MTKRQPKGAVVHVTPGASDDAVYFALLEQLFEAKGSTTIARLLTARLRDPDPHPKVIAAVACLLDPLGSSYLKLVVARRRGGKESTRQVNDLAVAKAVKKSQRELIDAGKPRHGSLGLAVRKIAKRFEISQAKVRKAMIAK
jgi:hypothetical protein